MSALAGRVALVTGASRGIGRAIAIAFAKAGADVAVNYRVRAAEAESVVKEIRSTGRRAIAIAADVSQSAEVTRMVATVTRELGPAGVLVNNAGIARPQPLDQITEQDWNELIAINLTSCFLVTQAILPAMRAAQWGATHQPHVSRRATRRRGGSALRRVEGRHDRADAFLCRSAGERGHHRQRDLARVD